MASRSLGTLTLDLIARIGGFEQGMDRAARSITRTSAIAGASSKEIITLQNSFRSLASVAASIAGPLAAAFSVKGVYDMTESYGTLTNRLKLVTSGSAELAAAQKAVFEVAQSAAQPLAATAELYQRIATNQDVLKLSGEGVAGIVGTISKTLAISGSSAASADAALVQLGQAFAAGTLRGAELNSVLLQAPALAQAIAAGMGKTVGDLKGLGEAGKLTADAVVKALQSQAGAVEELFAKTATTVGNSFTKIGNSLTHFVGELDHATGASNALADKFVGVSKIIDDSLPASLALIKNNSEALSQTLTTVLYVALGRIAGGYAASASAAVANSVAVGRLTVVNHEAAVAAVRKAEVDQVSAKNALQLARMNVSLAVSVKDVAIAEKALDAAKTKALAMSVKLSQARGLEVAANTAVTASTTASGVAMGFATRAATSLRVAASGLLALVGGPAGLLFIAGAAALSFVDWGSKSQKLMGDLSDLDGTVDQLRQSFIKLNEDQRRAKVSDWQDKQLGATMAVKEAYDDLETSIKSSMVSLSNVKSPDHLTQLKEFEVLSTQLTDARIRGESLTPILDGLASRSGVKPGAAKDWVELAGKVSDAQQVLDQTTDRLNMLSGALSNNTIETQLNSQSKDGMTSAGQKYLATMQAQLAKLQDNNDAVKETIRYLAEHTDFSEADRVAILSNAYARKAQTEANKAGTSSLKSYASEVKSNQKTFDDAQENYRRQIELINTTTDAQKNATEVEKLAFEVSNGKYAALSEKQKKLLEGKAAELDVLKQLQKANLDAKKIAAFQSSVRESNQTVQDGFKQELEGSGRGDKYKARLKEMLALEQDFNKQKRDLTFQRNNDDISEDIYKKETAILDDALATRLVMQQDYYNQVDDAQSNWMDGVTSAWEDYVDAAQNYSAMAADATSSILDNAKGGLSNFLSDVMSGAKSADDALGDMVANFAKSTLQALTDMAAQWLVYQAVQLVVGKTTQASAGLGMVANAQATAFQASLAAFASTAAIPVVGPAMAPAAALAAATATAPMVAGVASAALTGMAHNGMDNIPREGTWLLDGGERVLNPNQNRDFTEFLNNERAGNGGAGANPIVINAPVSVQAQAGVSDQDAQRQGEMMGQALTSEIRRVLQDEMQQGGLFWRRP
ncbi:hypothetical protein TU86_21785 [Pseudomonas weihenstephanensis]|uniref:Uncharacterized protein n=1 Tax=Pseudomonas weihenstephanensis TaxID=1608994 RepID=A0A0J6ID36_9PSED|nr:phage tail tape measure protein [Pseudomonas weihenstephanensis]KMN10187.1 hypothetical protein TU86_21785 [Pseudomonas weihenstephanensis]